MKRRKWSEVEAILLDLLVEEGVLYYAEVAVRLNVALPTASQYCIRLANSYPENIEYNRGYLTLKKPFLNVEIEPEKKIIALKTTLEAEKALKAEIAEKLEKIAKNHLPHGEYEKTLQEIKALLKKLRRL